MVYSASLALNAIARVCGYVSAQGGRGREGGGGKCENDLHENLTKFGEELHGMTTTL